MILRAKLMTTFNPRKAQTRICLSEPGAALAVRWDSERGEDVWLPFGDFRGELVELKQEDAATL
jgi:hypothetical protein